MVASIKQAAASGIKWTSASQVGRQVMQWITMVVLARLLVPADFGLVGMAMVVIGFVMIFKDLGTSAAVIQRQQSSDELLSSIFWVNVAFGLLATVILFFCSPLIGAFYGDDRVTAIMRLLSLTFFISGLSIMQQALLERDLKFDRVAKIELSSFVAGSVIGIGVAVAGLGVWSLVIQTLAVSLMTTLLLWIGTPWHPRLFIRSREVKEVCGYSLNLAGFNIFNYFSRNADNLLVGRFLGATELGYYSLAYRIMLYPLQSITLVIGRIMFPVYSQMQDNDARFRGAFLQTASSIAFISFPLMLGLMVLRHSLILVLFGSQWQPVIVLVAILAPIGMIQSIMATVGPLYQAKGRTDLYFGWGVVSSGICVLSFVIGLRWGIVGVASAYAIANILLVYPCFAIPFRLIDLPMRELGFSLWRPLLSSLLMTAVIAGARGIILTNETSLVKLGIMIAIGAATYSLFSWMINRNLMRQMASLVWRSA
ncbi:MAG: MOP flippase family protein [Thermoleophilia bacterium]